MTRIHATCIAIHGHAVLLTGASGSGKSDLALRLIDRGAQLVSDDYTDLCAQDGRLIASPPETIQGRMEARGLGIMDMPFVPEAPVCLLITLDQPVPRLPLEQCFTTIAGIAIETMSLSAHEASAPIKVEMAVRTRSQ